MANLLFSKDRLAKGAAFGIVDSSLEGAIVTPDFLVYDIDTTQILPEYLELVLTNDAI